MGKGTGEVDFHKFDPKFTNTYEVVGYEWGEFHRRRNEWINENRGKWVPQPAIPTVEGLVPKVGRLPATRNWYRRTSSFERNGFFNIHTPVIKIIKYIL